VSNRESGISRRVFLKTAAAGLAAPWIVPASALGGEGRAAPSDRIVMGCIGVGSKGRGNLHAFLNRGDVQMVAVCDVDAGRRGRAKQEVEDFYAAAAGADAYAGCEAYRDFRDLLARDDIDAVMIATPDHWHALPVIEAARAGKDMYCEKPLSLTIAEGRAMSDAVRRYGRVFQTGSQQRSDGRFRQACELVRNGRIGRLHTMTAGLPTGHAIEPQPTMPVPEGFDYGFWLGPSPWAPYTEKRCHYQFRWIFDYSGGQVTDWGAHHVDIAQWGHGSEMTGPVAVEGRGEFPENGLYNTAVNFRFTCTYADGVRLVVTNRAPNGVRFEGDAGWVFVKRGGIDAEPKGLLSERIGPHEVRLYASHNHVGNFLDCVRSRRVTVAPIEAAHRSISICHLGNIAMLLERKVRWDPERERVVGDAEADRLRSREMREPWRL